MAANIIVKEVVMFRKTMIALATVAALGALTPTAADARGGFGADSAVAASMVEDSAVADFTAALAVAVSA
jgi:hypothetical protein